MHKATQETTTKTSGNDNDAKEVAHGNNAAMAYIDEIKTTNAPPAVIPLERQGESKSNRDSLRLQVGKKRRSKNQAKTLSAKDCS